ncbi:transcriptional adapter 3 [Manacus vitellinus]|uniref:transcriptional adapter 3 n=1 Tax=Manacus vitellinus TaxID=328815 RepID=UPI00115E353E|nr:transcriptional adapter 3 [Manacus vitellinus]
MSTFSFSFLLMITGCNSSSLLLLQRKGRGDSEGSIHCELDPLLLPAAPRLPAGTSAVPEGQGVPGAGQRPARVPRGGQRGLRRAPPVSPSPYLTSTSGLLCRSTTCEEKFSRHSAACSVARTAFSSSASRRLRVLEAETQILTDWQDKKGDRRFLKLSKDHDVGTSVKHGKPKKQKLEGKGGHGTGPGPGRPKSKNLQPKIQEYEFQDDPIEVPRIPKNDAPNRFWASVEPYCADLTNEEVRVLEELLKPPEDEAEHYKIPPLGKHYSQRWAQEDLLEEQKDGARAAAAADKKKGVLGPLTELDTKDVDALLKKSEAQHEQPEDGCPFGPLTQRLLQALVEENIISPVEDSPIPEIAGKDSGADGAGTSPRSQNKPFSVPHTKSLEGRIKEELVAQGLLDGTSRAKTPARAQLVPMTPR